PETSRYVYFGAVLIVLIAVELLRGVAIAPRALLMAAPLVALCALVGLDDIDIGAGVLRTTSQTVKAELGALQLVAARAPAAYEPDPQRAPQIKAGPYLQAVRAIGSSPADTPAQLLAADPASRAAADNVLLALAPPQLSAVAAGTSIGGPAPAIISLEAGTIARRGSCVLLAPVAGAARASFRAGAGGVLLRARGAPASALARSFGDVLHPLAPLIPSGGSAVLRASADASAVPWTFAAISSGSLAICAVRG
ncbi:MAG TPA: hypothetical protein VMS02_04680, partial [Solirubrobacteraceae bacterium]|nr:hypothetical protein [Solirubrobacteraceae bacterium]